MIRVQWTEATVKMGKSQPQAEDTWERVAYSAQKKLTKKPIGLLEVIARFHPVHLLTFRRFLNRFGWYIIKDVDSLFHV